MNTFVMIGIAILSVSESTSFRGVAMAGSIVVGAVGVVNLQMECETVQRELKYYLSKEAAQKMTSFQCLVDATVTTNYIQGFCLCWNVA